MRRPRSSHPHHFDGMPTVNLWGMDRRDVWRTCFCFHVRTATVFIGVLHLMSYVLTLSYVAANFMYEPNQDGLAMVTMKPISDHLPTPQSKISPENIIFQQQQQSDPKVQPYIQPDPDSGTKRDNFRYTPFNSYGRKLNSQAILLEVCNMLITLLMVYGAVRGKPSYLMPFFVLKVFDFCIFCLKMVGIFSYLPNVQELIANQPGLPFQEELLRMDPQHLSLLALIVIVSTIAIKAYIIGVIWNCYKYLMLRNTVIRGVIAYRQDDPSQMLGIQQNLLPDLPDYETAVNDPRYAKKPPLDPSATNFGAAGTTNGINADNSTMVFTSAQPSTIGLPPPPYSAAVAVAASEQPVNNVGLPEIVPPTSEISSHTEQQQLQQTPSAAAATTVTVVNESSVGDGSSETVTAMNEIPDAAVVIETSPSSTTTTSTTTTVNASVVSPPQDK